MTAWAMTESDRVACQYCDDGEAVDEWKGEPICGDCYERVLAEPCEDCGEKPCGCIIGADDDYDEGMDGDHASALESVYGSDNDDYEAAE